MTNNLSQYTDKSFQCPLEPNAIALPSGDGLTRAEQFKRDVDRVCVLDGSFLDDIETPDAIGETVK